MTWYGGTLSQNRTLAEQAWRSFVDTVPVIGETTSIAASF
jgi:hypothetical protein